MDSPTWVDCIHEPEEGLTVVAVVVGASVGGARAVQALRRRGYPEQIILLGEETQAPYDRPPLSKAVLSGQLTPERIRLLRDADLADPNVHLRLGTRAERVHAEANELELVGGERVGYDHLIIATGASARLAPWDPSLPVLRTLHDSRRLSTMLLPGRHLVVIGGGFIGSEVAATARGLGLTVTVVDPLVAPIARFVGDELGAHLAGLHAANGVQTRFGLGVSGVERRDNRFVVHLADETTVVGDVVLVGIGAVPNDAWAADSGLPTADGVLCDEFSRVVGRPNVYAIGDVARWTHARHGERIRIEHWTNAVEQADCVAHTVVDPEAPQQYAPIEYVWTDQYSYKIQILGRPSAGRPVFVVDESDALIGGLYGNAHDELVGAVTLGRPRAMLAARGVLTRSGSVGTARARWGELIAGTRTLTNITSIRMIN
jgi:3-phenylpropionate/trans-cinnamate dioxygenase ferredoxin reductase component